MLRSMASTIARQEKAWELLWRSSHASLQAAGVLLSQEAAYSSSQHTLTSTATWVAPSIAASTMNLTAQQTSARTEQSQKLFMAHSFHASALQHPSTDRSRHSAQLPANAAILEQHGNISSTARAAESMAKDKTDLTAGAATAAAAQTMQQQPSAHGLHAAPHVAKVLGFAGAIPFLALAPPIAQHLPFMPADLVASAALLQLGYGASIASFLGGIHWALAMAEYGGPVASARMASERYIWSVTPCLMAWPAVALQPGPGSLILGAVLGIVYAVDRSFAAKGLVPAWYMALRLPLTLAAVSGMSITLVGSLLMAGAQL